MHSKPFSTLLSTLVVAWLVALPVVSGQTGQPAAPATPPPMPPAPPDVAAPPADAQKTKSGLFHKVVQPGEGTERPGPSDTVSVNYTAWTLEGKAFDSTVARNRPSTFSLERVMKGMAEGIQMMVVGEKRRFWIPEPLAFNGAQGRPRGMVVFEVELLEFEKMPTAPADVRQPPSDAKRIFSGVSYKVLTPGTGTRHPTAQSRVTVHYSGWTTDGKMFDSSVQRDKPLTIGLNQVIKGWTDGIQLMVTGEKTRFWIPEDQAYKGQPGGPRGMLVFDIELISID